MNDQLVIHADVAGALTHRQPVVALESTLITHGLPWPRNLECARAAEQAVRDSGAVPATIAVLDGHIRVGLDNGEIEALAQTEGALKASRRDLAIAVSCRLTAATTVSATMLVAAMAGIEIFATGGIGGVHRGAEHTFDISADLTELGRTPVTVICAGAKVILDLPRTLEVLETAGVPIIGFGTDEFPGFFCRHTGLEVSRRLDDPASVAALVRTQRRLGITNGILIAQPPPAGHALDRALVEGWVDQAMADAAREGVQGKSLTPFLLSTLVTLSGGATLAANIELIKANASLGGAIAARLAATS